MNAGLIECRGLTDRHPFEGCVQLVDVNFLLVHPQVVIVLLRQQLRHRDVYLRSDFDDRLILNSAFAH